MKKIALLGLTGSIGLSVIEVVRKHPDLFKITLATSHNSYDKMMELAEELNIEKVVLTSEDRQPEKSQINKDSQKSPELKSGNLYFGQQEVLNILASTEFDIVVNAISGSAGLIYSYHVMQSGLTLALANKESLVMAGHLFSDMIRKGFIIPIDSEHSALFQILQGLTPNDIRKIIITASGGPFRELPLDEFRNITPGKALQHPTWSMGIKITIDSATMFNKGLEVIEAHHLFDLPYSRIEAVIHPQSVIHSLVECSDGSILAQLSNPSMHLPVLYALSYPQHIDSDLVKTSLTDLPALTFSAIDPERYPLYKLTREAGETGGIMPTVLNAANEAGIKLFLESRISYCDIYRVVLDALNRQHNIANPDLETILNTNKTIFNNVISSYG